MALHTHGTFIRMGNGSRGCVVQRGRVICKNALRGTRGLRVI